jgi:hypothetical protein
MRRLHRNPPAERERRFDIDAVERHLQVGAREAVAMDIGGDRGFPAERLIDLRPVDVLRAGGRRRHQDGADEDGKNCTHGSLL